MEGKIFYTDTGSVGNKRVAGIYGKDVIDSDRYVELIQIVRDLTEDPRSEILMYDPKGEFMTVNIEESPEGSISVLASDGSVNRTAVYNDNIEIPGTDDLELFEEYVEDVLEEEDMDRLRETNVQGFKGSIDPIEFEDQDNLNPEDGFR